MTAKLELNKKGIIRKDTFRNYIRQRMAEVVTQVKYDPDKAGWGTVNIGATALDYEVGPKGPRWSIDVGKLDVFEDNLHAQQWFLKRYPNKNFNQLTKPHQVDATLRYVDEFLNSLPEGVEVNIKGHAIRNQGGSFSKPTAGAKKDKLYKKRWGDKPGFIDLGEGKGMSFTKPVTKVPVQGAPNEWIDALSHEDYRHRKRLSPDRYVPNVYGQEWNIPREDWWHVESTGKGVEGRLKSKSIAYDNLKSGYRRAIRWGQTPKMNAWEWQAIDELYKYAQANDYHVDHIIPLDAGKRLGRNDLHKWDNLQVLDKHDNLVKGAKESVEGIVPKMTGQLVQGPMDFDLYTKYTKIAKNAERAKTLRKIGKVGKYALGPASVILTELGRQGYAAEAQEDPTLVNRIQHGLAEFEATTDKAGLASAATGVGLVATPFLEGASMVAGLANTGIDIGEHLSVEENRAKLARKIGDSPRWVVNQFKSRSLP